MGGSGGTYAAVAANISILLAFVAEANTKENIKVKTQTRPSRILTLSTTYKTMMDTMGANEDATVPMTPMVA
jgi:hypothetical protein